MDFFPESKCILADPSASKQSTRQGVPVGLDTKAHHAPEQRERLAVQSLVRVAREQGRPGDHIRMGHFVEHVPRIPRESAPQCEVREGGGEDGGGRA